MYDAESTFDSIMMSALSERLLDKEAGKFREGWNLLRAAGREFLGVPGEVAGAVKKSIGEATERAAQATKARMPISPEEAARRGHESLMRGINFKLDTQEGRRLIEEAAARQQEGIRKAYVQRTGTVKRMLQGQNAWQAEQHAAQRAAADSANAEMRNVTRKAALRRVAEKDNQIAAVKQQLADTELSNAELRNVQRKASLRRINEVKAEGRKKAIYTGLGALAVGGGVGAGTTALAMHHDHDKAASIDGYLYDKLASVLDKEALGQVNALTGILRGLAQRAKKTGAGFRPGLFVEDILEPSLKPTARKWSKKYPNSGTWQAIHSSHRSQFEEPTGELAKVINQINRGNFEPKTASVLDKEAANPLGLAALVAAPVLGFGAPLGAGWIAGHVTKKRRNQGKNPRGMSPVQAGLIAGAATSAGLEVGNQLLGAAARRRIGLRLGGSRAARIASALAALGIAGGVGTGMGAVGGVIGRATGKNAGKDKRK